MLFRIAAISCFALISGMFALPAFVEAVYGPSLSQGFPNPLPTYEHILVYMAVLCIELKWLVGLLVVPLGVSFTIIGLHSSRARG